MANTFTTVLGYMGTRVRQRLGVQGKLESLNDIFNFIQLDDRVATSGQPTEAQFSLVKEAGYTTVINLAPKSHENALGNEDEILKFLHQVRGVDDTVPIERKIDFMVWRQIRSLISGPITNRKIKTVLMDMLEKFKPVEKEDMVSSFIRNVQFPKKGKYS